MALLTLVIMAETVISSNLLPLHLPMQDEDYVVTQETEIMKIIFENYYNVDIAREIVNQMQEQVFLNDISCCEFKLMRRHWQNLSGVKFPKLVLLKICLINSNPPENLRGIINFGPTLNYWKNVGSLREPSQDILWWEKDSQGV